MSKPLESIRILRRSYAANAFSVKNFFRLFRAAIGLVLAGVLVALPAHANTAAKAAAAEAAAAAAAKHGPSETQLEQLCRDLKNKGTNSAYSRLAAFAKRRDAGLLGRRAALALGYYDFNRAHFPEARRWLDQAQGDPLLREYAVYWDAETNRMLGKDAEALEQFEKFRVDYPQSVMDEQALEALGEAALALSQPAKALVALGAESNVNSKPALVFLRARAREAAGQLEAAAADYSEVYYGFPLSTSSSEAGEKMRALERKLGEKFSAVPLVEEISRASALYQAHKWRDASEAYDNLLPKLADTDHSRALLRIAECRTALGGGPPPLQMLTLSEPDLEAERLYMLSQAYRKEKQEPQMFAAVDQAVARAPQSYWAEQALFSAGNYYWVQLDLDHAAQFYRRVVENFPASPDATNAHWRLAWQAYRDHKPEAAALLEEHLRKFPATPYMADALYWLGRTAERSGDAALARAYFTKLVERFPLIYFGQRAAERLQALGPGPAADALVLALIPAALPSPPLNGAPIPPAAEERRERAHALHTIAFDASEELELRAAYAATGSAELLVDAAKAAVEASRFGAAIVAVRQLIPQLESHRLADIPKEVWLAAYPLPYRKELERWSAQAKLDPMLVAGLIRQESAFDHEAVSHANANGLMQLLPETARKLARQSRVGYSRARLFDPEYNLRLGTVYFAGLRQQFGSVEAALASYNAGEDRVAGWQAGRTFDEPAEFVESIPFTETRDYVQFVMRNAAMYRALYGGGR